MRYDALKHSKTRIEFSPSILRRDDAFAQKEPPVKEPPVQEPPERRRKPPVEPPRPERREPPRKEPPEEPPEPGRKQPPIGDPPPQRRQRVRDTMTGAKGRPRFSLSSFAIYLDRIEWLEDRDPTSSKR